MSRFYKKLVVSSFILFLFLFVGQVDAASLQLLPGAKTFDIGQEFTVDLIANTDEVSINAAEATVSFPNNILELVNASKEGSVFSFWVEEPIISNENGTLKFVAGTPRGITGDSLRILRMNFKTTGVGVAEIILSNAVVTASDGKGTNVLSKIVDTNVSVGTEVVMPESEPTQVLLPETDQPVIEEPVPQLEPEPIVRPKRVVRTPARVSNLPGEPELRVPLYPDQTKWYNQLGEVIMLWDLTPDIIQVATKLDRGPIKDPGDREEELFTGKSFGILEEGIWYLRAQFRNNQGWGNLAYYKIALDTTPPLPFDVEMNNLVSDDPVRTIIFETQDSLSGVMEALIIVDEDEPIKFAVATTSVMSTNLPILVPGKHIVLVKVCDAAGNSVEDDLEFEVLPLPTPTITFFTQVVSQEEFIFASGESASNGLVSVYIRDQQDNEVFVGEVQSDSQGGWSISIEEPLRQGKYLLTVSVTDNRGAKSYVSEGYSFKVKPKVIISVGLVDLGWFEIILIIILIIVSLASIAAGKLFGNKTKREAYATVAGRDVYKLSTLLSNDLKELKSYHKDKKCVKENVEIRIKNMEGNIKKMKKYIGQEINKFK